MAGRNSRLDNSDFAKLVAEHYVAGTAYDEMSEELSCHKDTIRVWIKDPRVQAHARQISAERSLRISRKIDGEIEKRLADISDWDLKDIVMIRKEYLDRPLKVGAGDEADLGRVNNELAEAMDSNPEFAKKLMEMASGTIVAGK